jgi:predicted RNase H-like nuclease (RuvC/YqgF family)
VPEWVVTVIIGVLAAAPGIYAVMVGRHKANADASQVVTDTAVRLLAPLEARIKVLEARVAKLEEENEALETQAREFKATIQEFRELVTALWEGVVILSQQLDCNGIEPEWDMARYRKRVERVLGIVD